MSKKPKSKSQSNTDKDRIRQVKKEGYADNLLYSVAVIHAVEGIKTRVIQKAARDGKLKGRQLTDGGKWRFTGKAVRVWLGGE